MGLSSCISWATACARHQAQALMINDAAILPLRISTVTYEVQPYVSGLQPTGKDSVAPGDVFYESIQILQH